MEDAMSEEQQDVPEVAEARAASLRANARKSEAEAEKALAEARKAEAEAGVAEITLAKAQRAEKTELAKDNYHHIYVFDQPVGAKSVQECMLKLSEWARTDENKAVEIIFNSPGGSVVDGMALFDFIQQYRLEGHYVTTATLGMAASMAGILLQAGDIRVMGPEAWLLIHEGSFGAIGSVGQVEDTVNWVKKIQERILDIFAARSNMSKTSIKRKWHRKDWWLSSDECLKYGFVDEIRGVMPERAGK